MIEILALSKLQIFLKVFKYASHQMLVLPFLNKWEEVFHISKLVDEVDF